MQAGVSICGHTQDGIISWDINMLGSGPLREFMSCCSEGMNALLADALKRMMLNWQDLLASAVGGLCAAYLYSF